MTEVKDISLLEGLPNWMIYTLALAVIITPLVLEILRSARIKKESNQYKQVIDNLVINYEQLYEDFQMLLGVLYEKYANNLSLEVAKQVIELIYIRTRNCIIARVQDYLHDDSKYVNGYINPEVLKDDVEVFVSTKYYEDTMLLNKMTYKGKKLSVYLENQVSYKDISTKIISLITIYSGKSIYKSCTNIKHDITSYFSVLISKNKTFLETK